MADGDPSPDAGLMQEIYAGYGLAMRNAQKLEFSVIKLLVAFGVSAGMYDTEEKLQSAAVSLFGKTMGFLNRNLSDTGIDLPPLRDDLLTALIRRNFLAHDYFRERPFQTVEGQQVMIQELADASVLFEEVEKRLETLFRERFEAQGIDISGILDQRKPIVVTDDGYIIGNGSVARMLLAKERGEGTHPTIKVDAKWEDASEEERVRLQRLADRLP